MAIKTEMAKIAINGSKVCCTAQCSLIYCTCSL